ncbi:MAG: carbohydrate kinase family protein [Lachnospiraceae bacterium]|jgi:fructokinase|nr:carbohydrate kinase family protein [Lachnospiraceae bacterium]
MHKVLVVGDANVDIIVPYPKFLNEERTRVEYPTPVLQGGGTSANTAVALSRLGIQTAFLGSIGEDQYGKYIREDFRREGVDMTWLIVEPDLNTVGVFAFVDEFGERYLWGWPRVDQAFKIIDESKVDFEKIKEMSWVHSSGMALVHDTSARTSMVRIFKTAWEAGIPTSFDLNLRVDDGELDPSYEKVVREIISYSTYVLGSGKDEFYYLGEKGKWLENAKAFVTDRRTVIVRDGGEGSLGLSSEETQKAPAFRVDVVDTVGAGDVYNAGFIAARLQGKSLYESLVMGNAVSGYTVSRKGSRNCPHLQELEEFMEKQGATENR